ncbi:helix-turn-helix domain-containing protein [Chryseobacterium sp. SIMBA_038]|uniref:helix-turn-helix domain-containing protein n=1 Tax=Chryseobacterium sp. SIMBA_038 TaxID=3085780 RepID=UPI003978767D
MEEAPDYKRIYSDILNTLYPDKIPQCQRILTKKVLSSLDVITLNKIIFDKQDRETSFFNQRHRSYNDESIKEILQYQKKNDLNNTQIALEFKLSRNSIAKWKKKYLKNL